MNKYISKEIIDEFRRDFEIPDNMPDAEIAETILTEIVWRYASPEYFEREDFVMEYNDVEDDIDVENKDDGQLILF